MIPRALAFILTLSIPVTQSSPHSHKHSPLQLRQPPLLISHRGDKILTPEHTLASYSVALLESVDYVEPDLVVTKDGTLVCHHDITLKSGTDVASHPEFDHLHVTNRTIILEGKPVTIVDDWLISDFTYAELRNLTVIQANRGVRPHVFDRMFWIPTFDEFIQTVHEFVARSGADPDNVVGIIPELKHPSYHNSLHNATPHYMESKFLSTLSTHGYGSNCNSSSTIIACPPVVIQCFEIATIEYLSTVTPHPLLTLLDEQNPPILTYDGLRSLQNKTHYIGFWKELLYTGAEAGLPPSAYNKTEIDALGGFVPPTEIPTFTHSLGISVGVWTVYHSRENSTLGCAVQCVNDTKTQELNYFFDIGVDAVFVEGLCESVRIRDAWVARQGSSSTADLVMPHTFTLLSLVLVCVNLRLF